MYAIGLTGGIGTGKSLAAEYLSTWFRVVDADWIVHDLYRFDSALQSKVAKALGPSLLGEQGIDRQALRNLIASDPTALGRLSRIVHPHVTQKLLDTIVQSRARSQRTLLQIPLLYENGWEKRLDAVLLMTCPPREQIRRIQKRDGRSVQEAQQMIASQMPQEEKLHRADYLLANDGSSRDLLKKVLAWRERFDFRL